MGAFLDHLGGDGATSVAPGAARRGGGGEPTSIFHGQRLDYDMILELIPPGASVLDLGCGSGGAAAAGCASAATRALVGVELDERRRARLRRARPRRRPADLEQGLAPFADGQFDVVVLSQTLQAVVDTEGIIDEMLRVGRPGIVSFPNFAYRTLRRMLAEEGRAPKAGRRRTSFEWYNTPNRRFPSIADFEEFCARQGHPHATARCTSTANPAHWIDRRSEPATPTWRFSC